LDAFVHGFVAHLPEALCVVGVVCLLGYVYFDVQPRLAHRRYRMTDPERLRRYLERVVATPSLLGPVQKLFARESLAEIYVDKGQHAAAVAQWRGNLQCLSGFWRYTGLFRALEACSRRRLADSLKALGRVDEAAEEHRRAEEWVDRARPDTRGYLIRGELLGRENRYEEAYAEFQRALDLTPASETDARIRCMLHLVLTAQKAARPADCLRWAEEAVALGAKGKLLRVAHRLAGVACGELSRLEEAERHYRNAYDSATADNDRPEMAESLVNLAGCLYKRGELARANEVCVEAAAVDPEGVQRSGGVEREVLRAWGRYDDALASYDDHRKFITYDVPRFNLRMHAVRSLDRARLEAECGRPDDAWKRIQEPLAEFADDARLGIRSQAALSWVLAARGDAGESQRLAASLEPRLAAFERDPGTCRGVLYDLGMAACARGDHPAGIDCWTRYLTLSPDPVYKPNAYYHRGECYRQLGRLEEARADYQAAVSMGIDSHFSRLARQRLGELALS
jgi:tetratricopeptide (TPR) repeat protein